MEAENRWRLNSLHYIGRGAKTEESDGIKWKAPFNRLCYSTYYVPRALNYHEPTANSVSFISHFSVSLVLYVIKSNWIIKIQYSFTFYPLQVDENVSFMPWSHTGKAHYSCNDWSINRLINQQRIHGWRSEEPVTLAGFRFSFVMICCFLRIGGNVTGISWQFVHRKFII